MPEKTDDQFMNYADIAKATGIDYGKLRNMAKRGNLPAPDHRVGQSPVWDRDTITAWINRRSAAYTYADISAKTGFTVFALRSMLKAGHLPLPDATFDKEKSWDPSTIEPWIRQHQVEAGAWSFADITKATGLSYNTLRGLRKNGDLPVPDLRDGRSPAWSAEAIKEWVDAHQQQSQATSGDQASA